MPSSPSVSASNDLLSFGEQRERQANEGEFVAQQQTHRPVHHYRSSRLHLWAGLGLLFPLFLLLLLTYSTGQLPFSFITSVKMTSRSPTSAVLSQRPLRVMTFNIWLSGARVEKGLEKIARHIKEVDPDIVALQELESAEVAKNLTTLLGSSKWSCAFHPYARVPDTAILTKHVIKTDREFVHLQFERNISDFLFHEEKYRNYSVFTYGMGASIQLQPDGQVINFFSMHLEYRSYGPYAANNKEVGSSSQIMAGERNKQGYGRAQNMEQLINNEEFKKHLQESDKFPLVVAGDFNCPSHLDWTEETKQIHGGWVFEWPATKLLTDAGLEDSFRHLHPNVVKDPGTTWSTVQKDLGPEWDWTIPEPQDRIDFIFFKPSAHFRPVNSQTYAGKEPLKPIPSQWTNDWPSDHYSVITDFAIDLQPQPDNKQENVVKSRFPNDSAVEE